MDLGSTQSWLTTSDRSSGPTPQITKKSTLTSGGVPGLRAKDGSTYPYKAYLGAETLYIHI